MDVINYLLKLVILALPLFAIPALLKSSNSMLGKVYGVGQNLGNKLTGGMKEDAGKRAQLAKMETSARRTTAGLDQNGNLITDNRRNRFRRWAGGRATRTDAQRQNREAEAKRLLEDDVISDMGENADRYVGVGADRGAGVRVGLNVDKMRLKREIEEMEPAKLNLEARDLRIKSAMLAYQSDPGGRYAGGGTGRDNYLRDQFAQAQTDEQRAAIANLAMQNGAPGRDMVGDFASQMQSGSAEAQAFAAHLGKDHYDALEKTRPDITSSFVETAGDTSGGPKSFEATFKKVDSTNVGDLDERSFQQYVQRAASAGPGDDVGIHARQILAAAAAEKPFTQAKIDAMPPGFHDVVVQDAADYRAAPYQQSDRRLKRDVQRLGTISGIPFYRFRYNWEDTEYVGVMAQDVASSHPNAVIVDSDGFYRVDYSQLGIEMMAYSKWISRKS